MRNIITMMKIIVHLDEVMEREKDSTDSNELEDSASVCSNTAYLLDMVYIRDSDGSIGPMPVSDINDHLLSVAKLIDKHYRFFIRRADKYFRTRGEPNNDL